MQRSASIPFAPAMRVPLLLLAAATIALQEAGARAAAPEATGTPDASIKADTSIKTDHSSGPAQQPASGTASEQASVQAPVLIRADRQSYDRQRGTLVASGNVELTVQGWRLRAERLEYAEASRSLLASGRVQLWKGDQYLQASSLRYSDWEGSGELVDVYGTIDRDTLNRDLRADTEAAGPAPTFACPPLESRAGQRPLLELIPPRRRPVPALAAPPGCPGAEIGQRQDALQTLLTETALGPGLQPEPPDPVPDPGAAGPRVADVQYQQSLGAAIRLNLAAVIDNADSAEDANPAGGRYRPPRPPRGTISRLRFQATRLQLRDDRWSADAVAFTNDPFTPAAAWTLARQVSAVIDRERGTTAIQARSSRIVLDGRLSVAAINNLTIGEEATRLVLDADKQDRDGIYLGYNLPPIRLGERGSLELQPQVMLQRALEGDTGSYIRSGSSLGSPTIKQSTEPGDLFGLNARLNLPLGGLQLNGDLSLSTLNPDNIPSGTRSQASLSLPLGLSWDPSAAASLFAGYRERVYNGSLGLQNLIYAYGARVAGGTSVPLAPRGDGQVGAGRSGFEPLTFDWSLQSGQYQANLFESQDLASLWRSTLNLRASTLLHIWSAPARPDPGSLKSLRYAAVPVVPGLALEMGLSGTLATYSDGSDQNTLSLWGGPALTLGRFEKPWLDYSRVAVSLGGTLRSGLSPFGFDRAIDLRTLTFNASQQIYGPLVLAGGASFNIDPDSPFYGDASYSFVELKLQRRAYEIGVYYSPYDGIGGIRLTLNDFNFTGTGTPFVPRPARDQAASNPPR